jgi:hypothetical protein
LRCNTRRNSPRLHTARNQPGIFLFGLTKEGKNAAYQSNQCSTLFRMAEGLTSTIHRAKSSTVGPSCGLFRRRFAPFRCRVTASPSIDSPSGTWRIIIEAGEPGDRRPAPRKRNGREESPDSSRGELERAGRGRATRLVTPGGCVTECAKASSAARLRKVPQKIKPPVMLAPRRQAFGKTGSPPLSVGRIWQG